MPHTSQAAKISPSERVRDSPRYQFQSKALPKRASCSSTAFRDRAVLIGLQMACYKQSSARPGFFTRPYASRKFRRHGLDGDDDCGDEDGDGVERREGER